MSNCVAPSKPNPKFTFPGSAALLRSTLLAGLLTMTAASVLADITFENKTVGQGEDQRFSLHVRNEPIAKVIDTLAERYDFAIDGYPEHWSKDPMNFSATGDLERVLRSLLKDTSHVLEYHTDSVTQKPRIAGLKLLNEGEEGFMVLGQPQPRTITDNGGTVTQGSGNRRPGRLADRFQSEARNRGTDSSTGSEPSAPSAEESVVPPAQFSGLSRSLEQRARQSAGTDTAASGAQGDKATPAPADPGAPNADMQALTQKALQDVKGLADALRKAENSTN